MILFNKLLIILMGLMNITLITMAIVDSNWCGFVGEFMLFIFTLFLWWLLTYDID